MAKISLLSQNYSPIGATGKTPSLIPENIPKKTVKMAKNAIKEGMKPKKIAKNYKKIAKNDYETLRYTAI